MQDFVIKYCQLLSYFIFYIPFKVFYAIEGDLPKDIKKIKKGSLLVSNHQTHLDPWIIMSRISLSVSIKILPIRFPVSHEYMTKQRFSKVLKLLGCYDIGGNSRENMIGFLYTRELLKRGETVFLFPEGKISRDGNEVDNLKRGIEFFVKESKNVIFARMKGFNEVKLPSFRAKCSITFSPVQDLTVKDVDVEDIKMIFNEL